MLGQILNPVVILNTSVFGNLIGCAKPVLHHKQRDLVAVMHFLQHHPQADRINLPAPV
ncbi:hypothetical protein D3C76_1878640 [compost metagenome]